MYTHVITYTEAWGIYTRDYIGYLQAWGNVYTCDYLGHVIHTCDYLQAWGMYAHVITPTGMGCIYTHAITFTEAWGMYTSCDYLQACMGYIYTHVITGT